MPAVALAAKKKIPLVGFKAAEQHFAGKLPLKRQQFDRLQAWAKLQAFTVAKVSAMRVLVDYQNAVRKAIEKGETLADLRAAEASIMDKRGWTGLTPWHLEIVMRSNVQGAYGAGIFKQLRRGRKTFPFWQYEAINDSRVRETHIRLDGQIHAADSSFWSTHFPPWDYNCRCSVRPLRNDEVEPNEVQPWGIVEPLPTSDFTSPGRSVRYRPNLRPMFDPEKAAKLETAIDAEAERITAAFNRKHRTNLTPDQLFEDDGGEEE